MESGCDEIEYQAAKRECFLDSNFKVEEASNMLGGFMCMMPPHPGTLSRRACEGVWSGGPLTDYLLTWHPVSGLILTDIRVCFLLGAQVTLR